MYQVKNLETKNFKPLDFFKSKTGDEHKINNLEEFLFQDRVQEMLLDGVHLANQMQKLRGLLNDIYKNKIGKGDLVYGADFYYDDLQSKGIRKNILTGAESVTDSRYPDGKNNTLRSDAFAYLYNDITELIPFNSSVRGGYTHLYCEADSNFF